MSDPAGRHPADNGVPSEPKQAVMKVPPCIGCGGLPHPSPTKELLCLREALIKARAEATTVDERIAAVIEAADKKVAAAQAEARELRWELNQRMEAKT